MSHLHILSLVLIFIANNLDPTIADPPFRICNNNTNFIATTPFLSNLDSLLSSLVSSSSVLLEFNSTTGVGVDTVYGQYMCLHYMKYATGKSCNRCIELARQAIMRLCANDSEAIIWEELCQLRYSNQRFFGQLDVSRNIPLYNNISASNPDEFWLLVNTTLRTLAAEAAYYGDSDMYAIQSVPFRDGYTIYFLVQCTADLSRDDCYRCLQEGIEDVSVYKYSRGARLLSRSCYLRYELYAFYDGKTEDSGPELSSARKGFRGVVIIIVTVAVAVGLLVAVLIGALCRFRYKKIGHNVNRRSGAGESRNNELQNHNFHQRDELSGHQSALMDFASIQIATNFFSRSNFLGEGGFGPVYKGILRDGKDVAVKRLSNSSEQGTIEFMNEVTLIMKLQHKNLVKLLGCCVDGEEKLLVYEFMPNNSLDAILFNPSKRSQLDWSKRVNIINGIARGLLYLHEDSHLRIIHRDLKPGNVLLDNDMNPKISDFGTARNFRSNEGEDSTTKVAGTYGYMAPEYAMDGIYSIKTDVFSFGVMLLEIITGRKNAGFHKTKRAPSLLLYAWQLMKEGNERELVDPLLVNSCDSEEFSRYMQIGLLCVQEAAVDRPTMLTVVQMLRSESAAVLPQPKRPNALPMGTFMKNIDDAIASDFSVNGLTISSILPR